MSRRRWLRRVLALLAGSGVLVSSAVLGGVYWLNTEAGNDWIRIQIIKLIGDERAAARAVNARSGAALRRERRGVQRGLH